MKLDCKCGQASHGTLQYEYAKYIKYIYIYITYLQYILTIYSWDCCHGETRLIQKHKYLLNTITVPK